jgi:predicted ester cyclase
VGGSAVATDRIQYSESVASLLRQDTAEAQLGLRFVNFAEALLRPHGEGIDDAVTAGARFHELEAAGFPRGPQGFKAFRKQINAAFPDERVVLVAMRFPEPGIIETELACTATHCGELMGIPATGKQVTFTIHTRNRFEGERMAERWDRMDFAGLLAKLKS